MGLGVLCLETYWSPDPWDRRSSSSILELLEANIPDLDAHHRHVDSRGDIKRYLEKVWIDERYDVLMIASHGRDGSLIDESEKAITLASLSTQLKDACSGRVVYLAGCETVGFESAATRKKFFEKTQAAALIGYHRSVDWVEAAQMDFITLGALANVAPNAMGRWKDDPTRALTRVRAEHLKFAQRLGWRFYIGQTGWEKARRKLPDNAQSAAAAFCELALDTSLDAEMQVEAARALPGLVVFGAADALAEIIADPEETLVYRRAAIKLLSKLEGEPPIDALKRLAARDGLDSADRNAESLRATIKRVLRSGAAQR